MGDKKQILAVDDTSISLATIERTLKDKYDVIVVNSGFRALRFLSSEKPDLILLDVLMPTMDGIETLRKIRETPNGKDVPVIMLTSAQERKLVIESSRLGIYDYVLKPFNPEDLCSRVRNVFDKIDSESQ